jgi:mono/diheme cytochrome c family protein
MRTRCAGCHTIRGSDAAGLVGPDLSHIAQSRLTSDETWKLVTYIKSLRTRNEPQAPPTE